MTLTAWQNISAPFDENGDFDKCRIFNLNFTDTTERPDESTPTIACSIFEFAQEPFQVLTIYFFLRADAALGWWNGVAHLAARYQYVDISIDGCIPRRSVSAVLEYHIPRVLYTVTSENLIQDRKEFVMHSTIYWKLCSLVQGMSYAITIVIEMSSFVHVCNPRFFFFFLM